MLTRTVLLCSQAQLVMLGNPGMHGSYVLQCAYVVLLPHVLPGHAISTPPAGPAGDARPRWIHLHAACLSPLITHRTCCSMPTPTFCPVLPAGPAGDARPHRRRVGPAGHCQAAAPDARLPWPCVRTSQQILCGAGEAAAAHR
jgi:hypothetical protein